MWRFPRSTLKPSKITNNIYSHYQRLLRQFGPQGWWPTTPRNSAVPVYWSARPLRRLTNQERFEICLGTILTQNTSWSNVVKVLSLLQSRGLLSFEKLRAMPRSRLESCLRSSGYFRQKSQRAKKFLEIVQKQSRGDFRKFLAGPTDMVRKKLLAIKGIGPETADSMLLYAGGHPIFVVDAYTRRVGMTWGVVRPNDSYDQIQKTFMQALPNSAYVFGEMHALLVKQGKEMRTQ